MLPQNLRNSIIWEHCQLLDISEFANTLALELSPDISDENLSTFIKMNLAASVNRMVLEIGEVLCEGI